MFVIVSTVNVAALRDVGTTSLICRVLVEVEPDHSYRGQLPNVRTIKIELTLSRQLSTHIGFLPFRHMMNLRTSFATPPNVFVMDYLCVKINLIPLERNGNKVVVDEG